LKLPHKELILLLQGAYSGEKAAAYAYQGHAGSIKDNIQKAEIKQIEDDEWGHRKEVLEIMHEYDITISRFLEFKMHIIGKVISASCYVIGWFMPFYFAGRLESGNVCEYFRMMHFFNELGISKHNESLYEMGMKEKEHEVYFLSKIQNRKLLPIFEKLFSWGAESSFNNVDLEKKYPVDAAESYCKK
jgi:hypothetical protein